MKVISTKTHGVVDYVGGLALLLAPYLFGFEDQGIAASIPQALGVIILAQSVLTRYELGLLKVVPMKMHLLMDYAASLFLAASPFLFGFADEPANVWMPHLIVGLGYFAISLMTESEVKNTSLAG